jgi:hypothetical protein
MVFKKSSKIACACIATLAIICTTSYASSLAKTIQVHFNGIKIYVNDKLISPKDGNGKTVEPFIYEGTTYLPVRAVSEALGKDVRWDGNTNSVYIGEPKVVDESMAWLNELEYFNLQASSIDKWEICPNDSFKDSTDNFCTRAITIGFTPSYSNQSIYADYLINKKYTKISGKFVLSYDYRSTGNGCLKIYGDNKLLYTSEVMKGGVLPIDFDVDISGVEKLRIEVNNNLNKWEYVDYGLVDVALYK